MNNNPKTLFIVDEESIVNNEYYEGRVAYLHKMRQWTYPEYPSMVFYNNRDLNLVQTITSIDCNEVDTPFIIEESK